VNTEDKRNKRRARRNWAVFLALAAFVVLVYAITIVKIKAGYGP
jgi:hypothetical protein